MWTRRDFLNTLAAGGGVMAMPGGFQSVRAAAPPDVVMSLTASADRVPIWPGEQTRVLRFTAELLKGRQDAVRPIPGYLGPVLDFRRGERVRIHLINRIDQPTIVHWHGMIVPDSADGHPRFAISSGRRYTYDFTVRNPAGTYLYHPHPHGLTGKQVYFGLAGLLIVREPAEQTTGLPGPEHELNLIIQDRRVGADNQLVFRRMMMDDMSGVLGDRVLVNGKPDAAFRVAPRPYRLRLVNVSNARIYKLAWSDRHPMQVVAGDNGLFSRAEGVQVRPYVTLAPFERVELYEDFGARRGGVEVALVSRKFSDGSMTCGMMGGGGMMGGMMGGGMGETMSGGQGDELLVARFAVSAGQRMHGDPLRLPETAAPVQEGKNELYTRVAIRHMQGVLNGRVFEMTTVADDEHLPLNKGTVWTFANDSGGMMSMPHPMHIHGVRFRILE